MAYKRETKIAGTLYSTIQWLYQAVKLKPKSTVFFVLLCYDGEAIRYAESKWLRKLEWHYSPKSPILMMIKCFSMALWRSFSNLKSLTLRKWFQLPDFEWENPLDPIAVRPKHIHAIERCAATTQETHAKWGTFIHAVGTMGKHSVPAHTHRKIATKMTILVYCNMNQRIVYMCSEQRRQQ